VCDIETSRMGAPYIYIYIYIYDISRLRVKSDFFSSESLECECKGEDKFHPRTGHEGPERE